MLQCFLHEVDQIRPLLAQLGWTVEISRLPVRSNETALKKLQDVSFILFANIPVASPVYRLRRSCFQAATSRELPASNTVNGWYVGDSIKVAKEGRKIARCEASASGIRGCE